jgi:hypothetical protein
MTALVEEGTGEALEKRLREGVLPCEEEGLKSNQSGSPHLWCGRRTPVKMVCIGWSVTLKEWAWH